MFNPLKDVVVVLDFSPKNTYKDVTFRQDRVTGRTRHPDAPDPRKLFSSSQIQGNDQNLFLKSHLKNNTFKIERI